MPHTRDTFSGDYGWIKGCLAMRKPSIPPAPTGSERGSFDKAVKESLETIMGRRGGTISPLKENAVLSDVIAKVNEILDRLQ